MVSRRVNKVSCGVGNDCYRTKDVELWVNATGNVWCNRPITGQYKWIGTDGGYAACAG